MFICPGSTRAADSVDNDHAPKDLKEHDRTISVFERIKSSITHTYAYDFTYINTYIDIERLKNAYRYYIYEFIAIPQPDGHDAEPLGWR